MEFLLQFLLLYKIIKCFIVSTLYFFSTHTLQKKTLPDIDGNDMHIHSTSEDDCLADKVSLLSPLGDSK